MELLMKSFKDFIKEDGMGGGASQQVRTNVVNGGAIPGSAAKVVSLEFLRKEIQ
jgi:hypothetical protein